ncbi:E3 ubiquitin-protein ligase TRIM17-like [Protopterus annectens]|uniref:E3 ubiquitin-protein ligase TRIM17-like n=1 Tax=Protopterus annectens TaxID=7888 RepID=UPI001CF9EDEB|nr:E3 ubiquitin-protein ligase TRIM17-like [Protopterus annectens]
MNMAELGQLSSLTNEVTCSICLDLFTDPVSTECDHNFCRTCITDFWSRSSDCFCCPECQRRSLQKILRTNRQLGNIAERLRLKQGNIRGQQETAYAYADSKEKHFQKQNSSKITQICTEHDKKLNLFCNVDRKAICMLCNMSSYHRGHGVVTLDEAEKEFKDHLHQLHQTLNDKIVMAVTSISKEQEEMEHFKHKMKSQREKINTTFDLFIELLNREKQFQLCDLQNEEMAVITTRQMLMKTLLDSTTSLGELKEEIEERLKLQESLCFDDTGALIDRCMVDYNVTIPEFPALSSDNCKPLCCSLTDILKHLKQDDWHPQEQCKCWEALMTCSQSPGKNTVSKNAEVAGSNEATGDTSTLNQDILPKEEEAESTSKNQPNQKKLTGARKLSFLRLPRPNSGWYV